MKLRQLLAAMSALGTLTIVGACGGGEPIRDQSVRPAQSAPAPSVPVALVSSALVRQNVPIVVYDNDGARDTYTDDYVMALASVGKIRLRGMTTSSSFAPYNHHVPAGFIEAEVGVRQHGINLARSSGLTGVPDATLGTVGHLQRPASGNIGDTARLGSAGTDLILQAAAEASPDQPLIVLMGGMLTVVADAYLANPGLISNNVVVYYLGGIRAAGDLGGDYNSWADAWAAHIVFNRLAIVILPTVLAYQPSEWISVPRERILAELPDTAHRAWMHAKDNGYGDPCRDGRCRDGDAPPAVFLDDSGYVTSTLAVCPSGPINYEGHPIPSLRRDDAGECRAVLVTATDPARGTERWWATMRQAYGGGGGVGRASQVYRASSDYSATQGFRQWSYLASTGQPMTFNAATGWWSGPEGWCLISTDRAHPGRTVGVIRRWTAPAAGSIRTTGSARDVHDVDNNGVKVSILKNESLLWSTAIANGNFPGTGFDLTTSVAPGDQIDFVVDSLGNNYWDMTALDPTITFTAN